MGVENVDHDTVLPVCGHGGQTPSLQAEGVGRKR